MTKEMPEASGRQERKVSDSLHYEDLALKSAMDYFGEVLLPYLGIQTKVEYVMPTELIHLEMQQMFQDYTFGMEDQTIAHFEFASQNKGRADLRRYREYEAVVSRKYGRPVITYVLYSGTIKRPMTELTEGVNTYRIVPVIMSGRDADHVLQVLERAQKEGRRIEEEELVPVLLTPLMGGDLSQEEKIRRAVTVLKSEEAGEIPKERIKKMEAILYALAMKFLTKVELEEIKEVLAMTILGEMLLADGIEKGKKQGREQGIRALIIDNLEEGTPENKIIQKLEKLFSLSTESAQSYYVKTLQSLKDEK